MVYASSESHFCKSVISYKKVKLEEMEYIYEFEALSHQNVPRNFYMPKDHYSNAEYFIDTIFNLQLKLSIAELQHQVEVTKIKIKE